MLKRTLRKLGHEAHEHPINMKQWPKTVLPPGQTITNEYLANKYKTNKIPKKLPLAYYLTTDVKSWFSMEHFEKEERWRRLKKNEEKYQFFWTEQLSGRNPFTAYKSHKLVPFLGVLAGLFALFTIPMTYVLCFGKSEFQKKVKFLEGTIFFKRGSPYTPNAWDKVKKSSDGHYYIGKERLD